jgi:DNA-binding NarL/FixJ family response regulator
MVYRSATLQVAGRWPEAVEEAFAACTWLTQPQPHPAAGAAFYQSAELHRHLGQFDDAEHAYEQAARFGYDPQPGLALLRIAQGRPDAAVASLRRALQEAANTSSRARLLPAYIEVLLEADILSEARQAADDFSNIAATSGSLYLSAAADHAIGSVLLAEDRPDDALAALRAAHNRWRTLETPYEAARTRLLIARCCAALGDGDAAALELKAAQNIFEQLGAPYHAGNDVLREHAPGREQLSDRELQVLRLLATGKTNRSIADELVISEKTVARHISNIFAKIAVSSRSAATAYAYDHKLV